MSTRKTAQDLGVKLARWSWFRTFTRAIFGPAIEQLVAEQTNQILVDAFRHHRREFDTLDKRISERFELCQTLIAENVGKLRKEHAEAFRSLRADVNALSFRFHQEAGR
jgi:hypothetical protein